MEKVEFRMKPTKSEYSKAAWAKIRVLLPVRTYLIVVGLLLVACILWKNFGPESQESLAESLGFLAFLALVLPPVGFQSVVHHAFKRGAPRIEEYVYTLDKEGFGWKSDSISVRMSWDRARRIDETDDFILVRVANGPYFTIFKRRVSAEVLGFVRKIIANAPVKNKTLRPL